jgi:hypothetical protein
MVINFIVAVPFPWAPLVGGLSPLLRTPLPPSDTTSRTSFEDFLGTPAVSDPRAGDDKIVGLHGATVMQQALRSYGFTIGSNADWHPDRAELAEQIHSFLADIDPKTGYLRE